jgi:hypothetical protein
MELLLNRRGMAHEVVISEAATEMIYAERIDDTLKT